jgi:pyrimidine operon attenuation protein/uracil phosphoribosyltransferase
LLRDRLKLADPRLIRKYVLRVRQQVSEHTELTGYFRPNMVLVPVPGSAPIEAGGTSVSQELARAMTCAGLGREVWIGLVRARRVTRSAFAAEGARPSVREHYDSFAIREATAFSRTEEIMLIDDVVTKGRTLLAAASRVRETFPLARIRAFAMLRTLGLRPDVVRLLDPCVGEIRWRSGDARRNP